MIVEAKIIAATILQPLRTGFTSRDQIGALVTGADYRGLGIVRSLGRRGIPVWVLKRAGHRLAATSRYARSSTLWTEGDDSRRIEFLLDLANRQGLKGWVLFPTDDEVVGLVARHHDVLSKAFCLTIPPWDELRWSCDKRLLSKLAADLKIDQPWTFCPANREEVARLDCKFPVIIKPALREVFNQLTAAKAWQVDDRQSLLSRYDEARSMMSPDLIMIQEVIPGWGEAQFSYAALCQDGRPLASVVARRVRQYPMDFGQFSTYVETMDDPGVVEPSRRLLAATRFTGLVEVEFKRDSRDGRFKVLDVNPRVWGWHTVGSRVGVDFSHLLWQMVRGEPVTEVHARSRAGWVRMNTDVPVALLEIARRRLSLRDYLRSLRSPIEPAVFALDDPVPGLLEMPVLIYLYLKRLITRGRGA
jgi:predicted ATP-grasp superfamily ATP-dependent carboligase